MNRANDRIGLLVQFVEQPRRLPLGSLCIGPTPADMFQINHGFMLKVRLDVCNGSIAREGLGDRSRPTPPVQRADLLNVSEEWIAEGGLSDDVQGTPRKLAVRARKQQVTS